ncbi:MAG TPA: AsnC family transcriptional regulator [Trebonia sp.]|nr:AsnC family transcriptional regulator [Trebonia sp.]
MKTSQFDEVDRQLLHALVVSPRASFRLLAEVVGVSDQTVARRYRRMTQVAGLRVLGIINGERAGWVDWLVRIQATPGSAQRIADTLAARPDTRWVRLFSGGTEIACTLQARTPEQRNTVFLQGLPGSRHVTGIAAHSILHVFTPVAWGGYASTLTDGQLSLLTDAAGDIDLRETGAAREASAREASAREVGPATGVALRGDDDPLIAELARDGRAPVAALAAATHWHESTVRRRIDELQQAGLLYFDLDVDDALLGINVTVMLWLSVEPAHLEAAGRAVAAHPEVPFAAATTGPTNLAVSAVFRDTRQVYAYLTTKLAGIPGLRSVESAPIIGTLKRTGTRDLARAAPQEDVPRAAG